MRTVDQRGDFLVFSGLSPAIDNVGDMARAMLAGKESHLVILPGKLGARDILVSMDALIVTAFFTKHATSTACRRALGGDCGTLG